MTEELYDWLKRNWIYSNIKKYHKYFKIWVANITESQIIGFSEQMARQKSHCMGYDGWDGHLLIEKYSFISKNIQK